ncbi:MAG: ATPase domain-containing protein [Candidatus Aenigmatarchaeota archaeon]
MEKVKTGIEGLDEMLKGGVPDHHHVLVCGGPGTGKTLLCMEFLYRGAKAGEKGVFISLEELPEVIIQNVEATFPGWKDFKNLVKENKIIIVKPAKYDFTNFSDILQSYVIHHKAKRVVIDSATILKLSFEKEIEFRKKIVEFLSFVRNLNCITFLTAELSLPSRERMKYTIEQFVADGVIILYNFEKEEKRVRALEVLKMRGTEHIQDLVPMKITKDGIKVYVGEKVY